MIGRETIHVMKKCGLKVSQVFLVVFNSEKIMKKVPKRSFELLMEYQGMVPKIMQLGKRLNKKLAYCHSQ